MSEKSKEYVCNIDLRQVFKKLHTVLLTKSSVKALHEQSESSKMSVMLVLTCYSLLALFWNNETIEDYHGSGGPS